MEFEVQGKRVTEAQFLLHSQLSELFAKEMGIVNAVTVEYPFCDERKWRADLAILSAHILIECDGNKWGGGHRRGDEIDYENEKRNFATMAGWRVLTFANDYILDGRAIAWLKENL